MKKKVEGIMLVSLLISYAITGLILLTAGNVASFVMGLYLIGGGFLLYVVVRVLKVLERIDITLQHKES